MGLELAVDDMMIEVRIIVCYDGNDLMQFLNERGSVVGYKQKNAYVRMVYKNTIPTTND